MLFEFVNTDLKIRGIFKEVIGFILVVFISYLTTNYSNILGIYGGGGKLLGGTYLILLYVGMLIGKYSSFDVQNKSCMAINLIVFCLITIGWWRFICWNKLEIDSKLPFGGGFNPPSISFSFYAIFLVITLLFCGKFLDNYKEGLMNRIWQIMGKVGRHTLYIFLYHRFFWIS